MSSTKKNKSGGLLWEGDIIHLVFHETAAEVLLQTFELDDNIKGDVFVIKDDYSVGTVQNIYDADGWQMRKAFWNNILDNDAAVEDAHAAMQEDKLTVHNLLSQLQENEELNLWIWMGQNEQDVCGYYWLLNQFKELEGRIFVLYLNNLPFINEKGSIFYPMHIKEIAAKELLKARRLARKISAAEFELDGEEWKKICNENACVRSLEGGKKIVSQPDNYFDSKIVQTIGKETYRLSRLINQLSNKLKMEKPDLFWIWRMKHLAEANVLIENGDWTKAKDVTFKANNGELFQESEETVGNG